MTPSHLDKHLAAFRSMEDDDVTTTESQLDFLSQALTTQLSQVTDENVQKKNDCGTVVSSPKN